VLLANDLQTPINLQTPKRDRDAGCEVQANFRAFRAYVSGSDGSDDACKLTVRLATSK
jgi:hypothetical protein